MKKYLLSLLLLLLLVIFCFLNKTNEKYQAIIDFNSNRNNLKIPFITELVTETEENIEANLMNNIHNIDLEQFDENYKKLLYILLNLKKDNNYTFKNIEVKDFNVSNITNMDRLFYFVNEYYSQSGIGIFSHIDISNWDVSNVTDMSSMFYGCTNFDQNLNNWNVSRVTNMMSMFSECSKFNQNLNDWDVSNVENIALMFNGCTDFDQDLNEWGTRLNNVTDMNGMFYNCNNFNQDLSNWDVSNVNNMIYMFLNCNKWNNDGEPLGEIWDETLLRLNFDKKENIFTDTLFIEDREPGDMYNEHGVIKSQTTPQALTMNSNTQDLIKCIGFEDYEGDSTHQALNGLDFDSHVWHCESCDCKDYADSIEFALR